MSIWPAAQRKLTFLVPLAAAAGLLAVPVTTAAGSSLAASLGNPAFIAHHRELGLQVLPWAAALAATTTAQWLYLRGRRPGRDNTSLALGALVIVSAVGTTVIVALTGDAGARAVWGNR